MKRRPLARPKSNRQVKVYHLPEGGKGWWGVHNSSTSGASNNKVNTMEMFAGDGDNNELGNSQVGGEATIRALVVL